MPNALITVREPGRVFGAQDLKSCSDHRLDLFEECLLSIPLRRLYKTNWSTSCQLGLVSGIYFRYSMEWLEQVNFRY